MEISKIQLAAALVAALGITAPAMAADDNSATTDKTVKSSKVQLDDAAPKKEKKGKKDKSCKKGDKSCKAADKGDKKGDAGK